jgi:hypothetical protein
MVARGVGMGQLIDEPMSSGDPHRATIKAHYSSTQTHSPLQNPRLAAQVDAYCGDACVAPRPLPNPSQWHQEHLSRVGIHTWRLKAGWDNTYLQRVLAATI